MSASTAIASDWSAVEGAAGSVLHVRLNGRKLNVVGREALEQLAAALDSVLERDDARAVVLHGTQDAWIGGADLTELVALEPGSAEGFIGEIHQVCHRCRHLDVPVIAAIEGYCLGAGLEIAASCDLRVAGESARFGMPEVLVGIPSVVEAALLPRLVGAGKAYEMMFTGRHYDARQALEMGLVQQVVPSTEVEGAVARLLRDLVRSPRRTLALQKRLFRSWEELPLTEAIGAGVAAFAEAYRGPEPREQMSAWLKARGKPVPSLNPRSHQR